MKRLIKVTLLVMPATLFSQSTLGHGWVEFPNARQNICYEDGGYWADQIPNQACQEAYDLSGAYPFVQRNEVAANVIDYKNIDAVKEAIPNGSLCAAGSAAKAGLDIVSDNWQFTQVQLDQNNQFELVFHATAPHNPSYWEIYLGDALYDGTSPLSWDDLTLISTEGNVTVDAQNNYRITVTVPEGREGKSILYTRWQRDDAAGEGFYNCSDIVLSTTGEQPPIDPELPDPEPPLEQELADLGYFVSTGFGSVEAGDTVRFRSFDQYGSETSDIRLSISNANQSNWPAVLAAQFNDLNDGGWFIGVWHESMGHYMFDSDGVFSNRVFSPIADSSYQLSLIKAIDELPPVVTPDGIWRENTVYTAGKEVTYEGLRWTAQWWTLGEKPGSTGEWGVWRLVSGQEEQPVDPNTGVVTWSDDKIYVAGDKVSFDGQVWLAHWWTRGETPGTTGQWGVWRQ